MYYLHVGLKPKQIKSVMKIIHVLSLPHYIDGDGWETWGEALGTDLNDKKTLHVTIRVETHWVARLVAKVLMGETTPSKDGHYAVLTDWDNWSELDGDEGCIAFYVPQSKLSETDLRISTEFNLNDPNIRFER